MQLKFVGTPYVKTPPVLTMQYNFREVVPARCNMTRHFCLSEPIAAPFRYITVSGKATRRIHFTLMTVRCYDGTTRTDIDGTCVSSMFSVHSGVRQWNPHEKHALTYVRALGNPHH